MRSRPILIIVLILVVGFWALKKYTSSVKTHAPSAVENLTSPQQILEQYTKQSRLAPDRRFMKALNLLADFFGEQRSEDALATWNKGLWDITYKGKLLGQLPEFPDYSDYMKVLTDRAITLNKSHHLNVDLQASSDPAQDEMLDKFFVQDLIPVMTVINKSWGEGQHTQALLKNASRGLVYLTIQSLDSMGIGDEVPAQAWAILAAYKSLTGGTLPQEEALLAENLSYSNYAAKLSEDLPINDPIRGYLHKDNAALEGKKEQKLVQYLILKNLVKDGKFSEVSSYIAKVFPDHWTSMAILKSLIDTGEAFANRETFDFIPSLVLRDLSQITEQPAVNGVNELLAKVLMMTFFKDADLETIQSLRKTLEVDKSGKIKQLYAQLELVKDKIRGPFLKYSGISKFYESFFFSGLYLQGIYYLDQRSSMKDAKNFNDEIANQSSPVASEFQEWYGILAGSKAGNVKLDDIINRLALFEDIGPLQFSRIINETKGIANYGEPKLSSLIQQLCQKLDARPQNLSILGNYVYNTLLDLPLAEKLVKRAVELAPGDNGYSRVWLAYFHRDFAKLKELSATETLTPSNRATALSFLSEIMGLTNIKDQFKLLNQSFPSDFNVAKEYCEILMKLKNYSEVRDVAQAWIDQDKVSVGLERNIMQEKIANAYLEEGLYSEGFQYVEPYIGEQKNATFIVAIKLLRKLSRDEEAQALLQKAIDRYPDSFELLILGLREEWEQDRYSEAARLLKEWRWPVNTANWRWKIGTTFSEVFKDKPILSGIKAFEELLGAGFSADTLLNVIREVNHGGNSELAFKLNSLIKVSGLETLEILTDSYTYLRIYSGEQDAKTWFKQNVPQAMQNPLSMFLYPSKYYDLIWDMIENPESSYGGDFVWLMRAAGWLRSGKQNDIHHTKLIDYYEKHDSTFYDKIGRYLLNMETAQNVINAAGTETDKICEYSYYFAIKAEADGNLEEASNWYHVTASTGLLKEGEYRWAVNRLWEWFSKGQALNIK